MFGKIKAKLTGKAKGITNQDGTPWHLADMRSGFYGLYGGSDGAYDNIFADVSRIAEQIAVSLPYAIDENGERLKETPALISALYNPNKEMSGFEFFEALAVMTLVHPAVYILCHKKDGTPGGITKDNIGGFTFLQGVGVIKNKDGSIDYRTKTATYSDDTVISISLNINPYDITEGYSPTLAAKKWASLDDYIVDWQSGFFRNQAIPAGEFIVTAKDKDEFNAIVDAMQEKHRGAGRNNNVSYVHRPTSSIDGKPLPAQIEWVPFAQSNKDASLKDVFDQANKKTATAFGVPEEIKGFIQNSNYASVAKSEHIFDKYTVYPKLIKIWAKFTHEMNRITGGLGYAITADYQISESVDELKTRAETTEVQFRVLKDAVDAGYKLESAIDAFGLPDDFRSLIKAQPEPENPQVADNADDSVSQVETSFKSVKTKKKDAATDSELEKILDEYPEEQIEAAIEGDEFDIKEKSRLLAGSLLPVLLTGAVAYALARKEELEEAAIAAGYAVDTDYAYEPSEDFKSTYLAYLEEVTFSYSSDTDAAIHRTLEMAEAGDYSEIETNNALRDLTDSEFWRTKRLQDTEAHRSSEMASLDMANAVAKHNELEGVMKVWHLNPASLNHCELCEEMDGVELPLDGDFAIHAHEEGIGEFSAGAGEVADAHPYCHCYLQYVVPEKVKEEVKAVRITCPKCKKYICEAKDASLENIVCSRCKTQFSAKVVNGKEVKG